ncbi:MAG TPA: HAMP domain-containing protein [Deltaproteobacteria bacterium]|nr:HAMP domain-containing protein [Deltaproteobacteria bacterium]
MAIKSLQKRLGLLILLPVALLLLFVGVFGFITVRGALFAQWQESSIVKLQRAAHQIDMKLGRITDWLQMFHQTSEGRGGALIQEWILRQLREMKGVEKADLKWEKGNEPAPSMMGMGGGRSSEGRGMMRFKKGHPFEVTSPQFDAETGKETVNLVSYLKSESDKVVGTLEVTVRFDYLLEGVKAFGWWQTEQACLIDEAGKYLCHTKIIMKKGIVFGQTDDIFERSLLKAIKEKPYGTVLGPGTPPDEVGGFYRLRYAPWTIVLFAEGDKVLAPIIHFRNYYFAGGTLAILLILLLIRSVVGKMVHSFTAISKTAEKVATGDYGKPIPVRGRDEIAQLTQSFNTMVKGLKERDFIANTFGRYVDHGIAKELLKRPEAARLGGQKREVAMLMSDIRGFTPLAETLEPEEIIRFLNRYFSHLIQVIQDHQGIIVDFFGDAVLVFFDPFDEPVKPMVGKAVQCAFKMQGSMKDFNREMLSEKLPPLQMGIGINAGEVVVGNIGSETRAKYGIVGSPVNLTQRIQSTAEEGEVVVSDSVYKYIQNDVRVKREFRIMLKGVQDEATLYGVEAMESL